MKSYELSLSHKYRLLLLPKENWSLVFCAIIKLWNWNIWATLEVRVGGSNFHLFQQRSTHLGNQPSQNCGNSTSRLLSRNIHSHHPPTRPALGLQSFLPSAISMDYDIWRCQPEGKFLVREVQSMNSFSLINPLAPINRVDWLSPQPGPASQPTVIMGLVSTCLLIADVI